MNEQQIVRLFNWDDSFSAAPDAGPGTVVVLGTARGGTTMMAGVLVRLGVEFGDRMNDYGEDIDVDRIVMRLRSVPLSLALPWARREMRKLIEERHAEWGNWGFKMPFLTARLSQLAGCFPAARYVFVVRNPMAVALSAERNSGLPVDQRIMETARDQHRTMRFLIENRLPFAAVSYEAMVGKPEAACTALAEALGTEPSKERLAAAAGFIRPRSGYALTKRLHGCIDTIDRTGAMGWVFDTVEPSRALTVTARCGTRVLDECEANAERTDVARATGHPTGRCGFRLTWPEENAPSSDDVAIEVPEIGHKLHVRGDGSGGYRLHPKAGARRLHDIMPLSLTAQA